MSSKNIRVAWEDLKPGDKVHLKGSCNTYWCKEEPSDGPCGPAVLLWAPGLIGNWVKRQYFDYATRPAPRTDREPKAPGEYWLYVHYQRFKGWCKFIKRGLIPGYSANKVDWMEVSGNAFPNGWTNWATITATTHVSEALSAEEYYTRKAKGEL